MSEVCNGQINKFSVNTGQRKIITFDIKVNLFEKYKNKGENPFNTKIKFNITF